MDPVLKALGLKPELVWVLGNGVPRESIKEIWFESGHSFTNQGLLSLEDLARTLLKRFGLRITPLTSYVFSETLKRILKEERGSFPLLTRISRLQSGVGKIERAITQGRLTHVHRDEEEVMEARLHELGFTNPAREELRRLALFMERWMLSHLTGDFPFVLGKAAHLLLDQGWPEGMDLPVNGFLRVDHKRALGLEKFFWSTLAKHAPVLEIRDFLSQTTASTASSWVRYHSFDDACDALGAELSKKNFDELSKTVILAPGNPSVRRSLKRALMRYQIPVKSAPFEESLLQVELIRTFLLPLKTVARGFERGDVIDLIRTHSPSIFTKESIRECYSRGILRGLKEFQNSPWSTFLNGVQEKFGQAKPLRGHLEALLSFGAPTVLFELWKKLLSTQELLGADPLRKISARRAWGMVSQFLKSESQPRPMTAPLQGVQIHRFSQARLKLSKDPTNLHVLGVSSLELEGTPKSGDLWWSSFERDALSQEFEIPSSKSEARDVSEAIQSWIKESTKVCFWDALYDERGAQNENLRPLLKEFLGGNAEIQEEEGEPHPLRIGSYGKSPLSHPANLTLPPPQSIGIHEINATTLDGLSRCEFLGTVRGRWKIRDEEEPDWEPWAYSRGNVLHEAVAILIREASEGKQTSVSRALDQVLFKKRWEGMIRSPFAMKQEKKHALLVLEKFLIEEREYRERSGAKPIWIEEGKNLSKEFAGITVRGRPDRIDSHPDGLFIMDYKTSSALPSGKDMLEKGAALQTAFYAVSVGEEFKKPILGVQLISLTSEGGRKKGIFLREWNGKEPGKLTSVRELPGGRSAQVFALEPKEAWQIAEAWIGRVVERFKAGVATPVPKLETECRNCFSKDLCGIQRREAASEETE